jgi:hypothetical protein
MDGIAALRKDAQCEEERLRGHEEDRSRAARQGAAAGRELQAFRAAMEAGDKPRIVDAIQLGLEVKELRAKQADWERKLQIAGVGLP